jgi:hypothetical protein
VLDDNAYVHLLPLNSAFLFSEFFLKLS